MKETQILSTFQESGTTRPDESDGDSLVFDACQIGVLLRVVLLVEMVVAIVVMFSSVSLLDWLMRLSVVTAAALSGTIAWILMACAGRRLLLKMNVWGQRIALCALGGCVGLYGAWMLLDRYTTSYMPWLASALAGAVLAASVVAAFALRSMARMPAQTTARLSELQSRIRPHFLFNTLNSAIALVRQEPAKAEVLLEDLSDLFRHTLMDRGLAVDLSDEITLAKRYLAIEEVRFGERLRVQWRLDPLCDGAKVPPLLLQPLVENAVRHGVEPSDTGAELFISTEARGSVAIVKVTNTVPAGQGLQGLGLAQRNVRERLGLLHDVQGQFRCGLVDGVYQVRMEIPL